MCVVARGKGSPKKRRKNEKGEKIEIVGEEIEEKVKMEIIRKAEGCQVQIHQNLLKESCPLVERQRIARGLLVWAG